MKLTFCVACVILILYSSHFQSSVCTAEKKYDAAEWEKCLLLPKPPRELTHSQLMKWYREQKQAKKRKRNKVDYQTRKRKRAEAFPDQEQPIAQPESAQVQEEEELPEDREPKIFQKEEVDNVYTGKRVMKHRDIKKIKQALPKDPLRASAALNGYFMENVQSPTRQTLRNIGLVNTPDTVRENEVNAEIVNNINVVMSAHKGDTTTEGCVLRNVISATVVNDNQKRGMTSAISKTLNIDRRSLNKGQGLRKQMSDPGWLVTKRKTDNMGLKETDIKLAFDYWASKEASRATGNTKDVKRKRIGPKNYESHQIQVMEKTETEIYASFIEKYPEVKMCFCSFVKCRPFYVRPARPQDRQTCCCKVHVETRSLFKLCMLFRKNCELDDETYPIFKTLQELVEYTLCPKPPGDKYHDIHCLRRQCQKCGINQFVVSEKELSDSGGVTWERFEYVDINGKRKPMLVKKQTAPKDMFEYFVKLLKEFPYHEFEANWINSQIKSLQKHLPIDHTLCINDFSQNKRVKLQQETQSVFFAGCEITIHVTLLFRHLSEGNFR